MEMIGVATFPYNSFSISSKKYIAPCYNREQLYSSLSPFFFSSLSFSSLWNYNLSLFSKNVSYCTPSGNKLKLLPLALSPTTNGKGGNNNKKGENAIVKFAISGVSAVLFEFCIGHGLEFFKIAKQTSLDKTYYNILKEITHSKGIYGIWDGFFPW